MFGADAPAALRHGPRVLSSADLLAEMRRLRDAGRTTNAELARLLGLPSARIAEIFDEKRRVTIDEMKLIVEHFELGAPPSPTPLPSASIDKAPDRAPTRDASEGETVAIVALDLSASMGPGTLIEDFVEAQPIQFDIGLLRAVTRSEYHRLRVVRGIGDSMEPTLRTGDRVLVDTTDKQLARLDGIYWITLYGAHGIKRLKPAGRGRILVISDNRAVSDPVEVEADDITIEGRVIWFARDL